MFVWMRLSVTAMRLDRLLPLAAAALLAACNPQAADRSGAARAPIPAAQAPGPQATSAACPETPAPACVPDKAKAAAGPAAHATRVAARHRAVARKAAVHRAAVQQPRRSYRRYEALAGGPQPHSGYARVPHRDYARVPQDGYANGPATTYRYGPAYPPAGRADERDYDRYGEGRYPGDAYDQGYGYDRREGRRVDRYDRREDHAARREPPPQDRYGPGRSSRQDEEALYNERYGVRRHEGVPQPPPVFDPPDGRVYDGRVIERRAYEGRYESRTESRSTYESRSVRRDDGPCCRTEAAGFDANGFLTWPGKVPARP
jgi:hypothetical protein